jgi:hypothetical protein
MGLTAIAAVTWGVYSSLIGIGAGAWLHDHTMVAVAVGVVGGLVIGLIVDWILRRFTGPRTLAPAPAPALLLADEEVERETETAPPVTGRSRSDPAA